jgi:hypothetical protein
MRLSIYLLSISRETLIENRVDPLMAGGLFNEVNALGNLMGLAIAIKQESNLSLVIHHVLTGSRVCGNDVGILGTKNSHICRTEIFSLRGLDYRWGRNC